MAKSNYTKYRDKILSEIRKQKKLGIDLEIDLPLTERQLRQQGVKGQGLRKATTRLKNQLPQLQNVSRETLNRQREAQAKARAVTGNTGQPTTGNLQKPRGVTGQLTLTPEVEEATQPLARTPDGEVIPVQQEDLPNEGNLIYNNIMSEFKYLLADPPENPLYRTYTGRENYWKAIWDLINYLEAQVGTEELGYRLKNNLHNYVEEVHTLYYDSDQGRVESAYYTIITALNKGVVTDNINEAITGVEEEVQGFDTYE